MRGAVFGFLSVCVAIQLPFTLCNFVNELLSTTNDVRSGSVEVCLEFDKEELTLQLNIPATLRLRSTCRLADPVDILFNVSGSSAVSIRPNPVVLPANSTDWVSFRVDGSTTCANYILIASGCRVRNSSNQSCEIRQSRQAYVRVNVVHSVPLVTAIAIVGWIYFVAWSISFYPQALLNFHRKSVVGLNFDFLALNITGFVCYSVFNVMFYWNPLVMNEYLANDPHKVNPVQLNDVVFSTHAVFATTLTIVQCLIYERGNQRVSWTCWALEAVFVSFGLVSAVITIAHLINWLTFIQFLSYIKLAVTLTKYIPQAFYNYRRQSTVGWSIHNVLLDLTGGVMSLLQMFMIAYNSDDWAEIFGNFTKFGLGAASLLFDALFIVQHYVLYRGAEPAVYERFGNDKAHEEQPADVDALPC